MNATDLGGIIGSALIFGLPFLAITGFHLIGDILEWSEHRSRMKDPAYKAEMQARQERREERARRQAVQAHKEANTAEHKLWDHHYREALKQHQR